MNAPKDTIRKTRIEIYNTLLISLAALAIAWCSCQGTLWDGIQQFKLAQSNKFYRNAVQDDLMASQRHGLDAVIAMNFLNAVIENNHERINYYLKLKLPGLNSILSDWLSMDPLHNEQAPPHPLAMEEYKRLVKATQAQLDSTNNKADDLWKEAQQSNRISDRYAVLTVVFSLSMLLGSIAPKTIHIKTGYALTILAGAILFVTMAILIFFMPVTTAANY